MGRSLSDVLEEELESESEGSKRGSCTGGASRGGVDSCMVTLTGAGVEKEVKGWGDGGALRERGTDATRLGIRGRAAVAVFAFLERRGSAAEREKCIAIMEGELLANVNKFRRVEKVLGIMETRLLGFGNRKPPLSSPCQQHSRLGPPGSL